jgi:hypothetical protein
MADEKKYDPTNGREIVDNSDELFGDPPDDNTPADDGQPAGAGTGSNDNGQPTQRVDATVQNDGKTDPEKATPTQTTTPDSNQNNNSTTQPRVLAGKFNTEDELKKAYQNLGGNPDRFKTVEALEEAYEYRQGEYTRVQQENAEAKRIADLATQDQQTAAQPTTDEQADAMLAKVDWSKVETAGDLGKQLLRLFMESMPKNTPPPDANQLVEQIMPIMQEREKRLSELHTLETKVPRLTKDIPFRNAFGRHVMDEKKSGRFVDMDTAMKNFLEWGKSIVAETQQNQTQQQADKEAALQPTQQGQALPGNGEQRGDEVDDIIGSYKARNDKLNGFT